jgi:hypothetical protein
MFSFFRKSNKNAVLNESFNKLYGFTQDQKTAILVSLYEVANSDDEFHPKETEYHRKIGGYLGLNYSARKLKDLLARDRDRIYKLLDNMNESQNDWYVITVLGMIYSDGTIIQEELNHVISFLKGIGFSEERIRRNMVNEQ